MLRFFVDRRGSVSTIASLCIGVMVALAGLVVHGSQLYVAKIREQRTADVAVQAASSVSGAISGNNPSSAALAAALNVAELNGASGNSVSLSVVDDNKLQVDLSNVHSGSFGVSGNATTVNSRAIAKPLLSASPCIVSLSAEVGLADGSSLVASSCGVVAAGVLTVDRASLNASAAVVGGSRQVEEPEVSRARRLVPALDDFVFNNVVSDPLAGDARIATLDSKLAQMSAGWPYGSSMPVTLAAPAVQSGTDLSVMATVTTVPASARLGNLTVAGSTVTFLSNGPDPTCASPTTISGATRISAGSTIQLNSGCYVFKGDVSLEDSSTSVVSLVGSANVRIVVLGQILNRQWGRLSWPKGSYSITGGIINAAGGRIDFGTGPKVIGGTVDNGYGTMSFGVGPFYLQSATVVQGTGTMSFGNGPSYIYSSTVTNGAAGTMSFGSGPHYVYYSSIRNGDATPGSPVLSFLAGPYYLVAATLSNSGKSTFALGVGNMELYQSSISITGGSLSYGSSKSTSSAQVAMVGSTFDHAGGTVSLRGVTFAARASTISFTGQTLQAFAPTGATPAYGTANLLAYSQDGHVYFNNASRTQYLGGVIYAPAGTIDFGTATYNSVGRCLAVAAAKVKVWGASSVGASVCGGFDWPAPKAGAGKLTN